MQTNPWTLSAIPDRGEVNNTGDILETALILGRMVDANYYGWAERILRGVDLRSSVTRIAGWDGLMDSTPKLSVPPVLKKDGENVL